MQQQGFVFVFKGGWPVWDGYGTVTLISATDVEETIQVPANEIWEVEAWEIVNGDDVARRCFIGIQKSDGTLIFTVINSTVNANSKADRIMSVTLAPNTKIYFKWYSGGASSGGTGKRTVLYRRLII